MKKAMVFILLSLTIFCGCGKDTQAKQNTTAWSDNHQTAPMPEELVEEDDMIGFWTKDPDAAEPEIIEFYKEKGTLKYRYFRVLLGNGNGFAIAKKHTIFEYNSGKAILMGNQGSCSCLSGNSDKVYISFYCFDPDMETIADQEDGTEFQRLDDFTMPEK